MVSVVDIKTTTGSHHSSDNFYNRHCQLRAVNKGNRRGHADVKEWMVNHSDFQLLYLLSGLKINL